MTALAYGVSRAGTHGWGESATLTVLGAGLLALGAFAVVEVRRPGVALVPPRLVRMRAVWAGNLVMLLAGACFIPMWYFLSLYMQDVLHYSAWATGVGFLPHTLAGITGARLAPRALRRTGARTLIAVSALLAAAGFWWQSRIDAGDGYVDGLLGPGIVISAGMGLLVTPITATVTADVDPRDAGAASGLMNAARQIGGAVGLAALVTLAATADSGPAAYRLAFITIAALCALVAAFACALPGSSQSRQ